MHVKAVTIEIDEREKNPRFLYWHLSLFLSEKLNTDCFTDWFIIWKLQQFEIHSE